MTYPIAPGREPRRVPSSSTILLVLLSYYRRSRGELETPRLRVHGVALPTAELHPAPRAVIARREPTHGTELPRRRRRRRRRGGGEVGRDLRGDAIEHRALQRRREGPRRLLRLRRAARRALPALTPAFLLQDGAHACDERGEERTWGEVTIRSEGGRASRRGVATPPRTFDAVANGIARPARLLGARTLAVFDLVLAVVVAAGLGVRVIVLERVQARRGDLSWDGREGGRVREGSEGAGASARRSRRRGEARAGREGGTRAHLSSRVLIHALERLGDGLDARRLSLAHRRRASLARAGTSGARMRRGASPPAKLQATSLLPRTDSSAPARAVCGRPARGGSGWVNSAD